MADYLSAEQRSRVMRTVKSKDTALEIKVRSALWRRGLRFRKNVAALPGRPDIVFGRKRIAVFVDSCFWHGCPHHLRKPKSNQDYWNAKIQRNVQRDAEVGVAYAGMGWEVIRVWEHELIKDFEGCLARICEAAEKVG